MVILTLAKQKQRIKTEKLIVHVNQTSVSACKTVSLTGIEMFFLSECFKRS